MSETSLRALRLFGATFAAAFTFYGGVASAHISLEQGGTHKSRYGDGEIKDGPCGRKNGTRGTNIYTYAPGETITVKLVEYVPHPSYYRWAFDNDGDDAFKEPASIKPIDPNRACPDGAGDHCGAADYYNNAAVLPGMDDLNPHLAAATLPLYTWQIKLPNVECTNCTLQVIQVMEDDAFHGPYDPTPGVGVEDIYHQCIDIVLKAGTPDGGVVTVLDAGATDETDGGAASTTDAGRSSSSSDGGKKSGDAGAGTTDDDGGSGDDDPADDTSGNGSTSSSSKSGCSTSPSRTAPLGVAGVLGLVAATAFILRRRR